MGAKVAGSIASKTYREVPRENGIAPVGPSRIQQSNTAPNEKGRAHIKLLHLACSGDMYATVPSARPGAVVCSGALILPLHRTARTPACATLLPDRRHFGEPRNPVSCGAPSFGDKR